MSKPLTKVLPDLKPAGRYSQLANSQLQPVPMESVLPAVASFASDHKLVELAETQKPPQVSRSLNMSPTLRKRISTYAENPKKIYRIPSLLDTESKHTEDKKMSTVTAAQNKRTFMQNYGIQLKIPSLYVLDSKFFRKDPEFLFQITKTIFPTKAKYLAQTHTLEGEVINMPYERFFEKQKNSLVLQLLQRQGQLLVKVDEVIFPEMHKAKMCTSKDGKYMAVYFPEKGLFKVLHLKGTAQEAMELMKNDAWDYVHKVSQDNSDMSFVSHLTFDSNNHYLVAYGETNFYLIYLDFIHKKAEGKLFSLSSHYFERIYDISFVSKRGGNKELPFDFSNFSCFIAARKRKMRQITVFNYSTHGDLIVNEFFQVGSNMSKLESLASEVSGMDPADLFPVRNLNFRFEPSEHLIVKISSDFHQIVLTDIKDRFILERQADGFFVQKKLYQLKDKVVHFIEETDHPLQGFNFLASDNYDTELSVYHSHLSVNKIKIPKDIEPGIIRVFDLMSVGHESNGIENCRQLQVAGMKDNEFILDEARLEEQVTPAPEEALQKEQSIAFQAVEQKNISYQNFTFSALRALSFNWPYIAFSGLNNHLVLVNAYDRRYIKRIQMAPMEETIDICQTFITDTHDLFVMVHVQGVYKVYQFEISPLYDKAMLGLKVLRDPIFTYTESDVDSRQLIAFHVRGSSRKEVYDTNQVLMIFFLHQGFLYSWTKFSDSKKQAKIQRVCPFSSKQFLLLSDSTFFFQQDETNGEGEVVHQRIMKVQINFSTYELKSVLRLDCEDEVIQSVNIDQNYKQFILLTKRRVFNENEFESRKDFAYKFKIFNLKKKAFTYQSDIKFLPLIGKLSSGLYTFVDGHIYYNNNVIKIRYDLINSADSSRFKENEIFDYYFDIFDLGESMKVRSNTPLDSIKSHRFAYFISDQHFERAQKLLILPYLHDRKIYLNRIRINTDYFYTSVRTPVADEEDYHSKVSQIQDEENNQYEADIKQFETSLLKSRKTIRGQQSFNSIICVNETEHYFRVFSQNGLLINKVSFQEHINRFGQPAATSNNGLNFIFRHPMETMDSTSSPEVFFRVNVMKMNIFGVFHIKEINLLANISELIADEEQSVDYQLVNLVHRISKLSFVELCEKVKLKLIINDDMDIGTQISFRQTENKASTRHKKVIEESDDSIFEDENISSEEDDWPQKERKDISFYYFECIRHGLSESKFIQKNGILGLSKSMQQQLDPAWGDKTFNWTQRLHIFSATDERDQIQGFNMNKKYFLFWTRHGAWSLALHKPFTKEKQIKMKFTLDQYNRQAYIKEIRTGSNPAIVVLLVRVTAKTDMVLVWNVEQNFESEAYEISEAYKVLWDQEGQPYIVLQGKVILTKERTAIKAFRFQEFSELESSNTNLELSDDKGHRFDGANHNWFILREFLALPFSYMTFVIKDKIEREDELQKGNVFDLEPYNYIFNKSTSFMDSRFVRNDHIQLRSVLENFNESDVDLLELLHYTHTVYQRDPEDQIMKEIGRNSPLHIAINEGNNMSVEIILEFMTIIKFNNSRNFSSIFQELVEFKSFLGYLADLPVQTIQMQKKHVLRMSHPHSHLIVAMKEAPCVHVDEQFFTKQMGEVPAEKKGLYKSYPVEVVAMRIGWIIGEPEGKEFLEEVLQTENLEIYKIPTIQMIVEFLYSKQKNQLLYRLVPAYLTQLIIFEIIIFVNEDFKEQALTTLDDQKRLHVHELSSQIQTALLLLNILNILCLAVIINFNFQFLRNKGWDYFRRIYSWLDIATLSLNFVVAFKIMQELTDEGRSFEIFAQETKTLRVLIVLCVILGFSKLGQFLSLMDSFAPIVDQITQIFVDIRYFVVILLIFGFCFANCFYVLAQSQKQFDAIEKDSDYAEAGLQYVTLQGAIWYIWDNMVLGNTATDSFDLGEGSQALLLYSIFVVACFVMLIHLLNMLIAIMGNTFAERSVVASEIRVRDHLRFVMDNWHLNKVTFTDIKNVKYIIAAFSASKHH